MDEPIKKTAPNGFRHHPQLWFCFLLTVMVCGIVVAEFMLTVPEGNQRVIDNITGSILTVWFGAMGYWYNTTFGSDRKTDMIAKLPPIPPGEVH